MTAEPNAVEIREVSFRYGDRIALQDVTFAIKRGEIFGLLGPNGSGKTTLFRILCTLLQPIDGNAAILGQDVATQPAKIRGVIGITFQSPSLDDKLTVGENLQHQGHLYGLSGSELRVRIKTLLDQFQLIDRAKHLVGTLSGGLKRRVELAKGLLHQPQLLLLDEPSTGLDPSARRDLWRHLEQLRDSGMTILLTTHLMDEAERCDRIAILDAGRVVAIDAPPALRSELGGDGVTIHAAQPEQLAERIAERFGKSPRRIGATLRLELDGDRSIIGELTAEFADSIRSLEFGKPTLDDVFHAKTGHAFDAEDAR